MIHLVVCWFYLFSHQSSAWDVLVQFPANEHGQKVEQSAAQQGLSPQAFVDQISVSFCELLDLLNIKHDRFVRTTDKAHKAAVQHSWQTLTADGKESNLFGTIRASTMPLNWMLPPALQFFLYDSSNTIVKAFARTLKKCMFLIRPLGIKSLCYSFGLYHRLFSELSWTR